MRCRPWVKEIPVAVQVEAGHRAGVPVEVVAGSPYGVVDVPVLQVGVSRESVDDVVVSAHEYVGVELPPRVVVILLQRVDGANVVAHPFHLSEVVAPVPVGGSATHEREVSALEFHVDHAAAEVIVVVFQADEVRLLDEVAVGVGEGAQAVFLECASGLVLVVVSVALGIVERGVERDILSYSLAEQQLEVVLREVVALVFVESGLSVAVGVFSAGVVSAAVFLHLLLRGVVPRHVGAFLAAECQQSYLRVAAAVGELPHVAPQPGEGAVDVSVGAYVAEPRVYTPVAAEESRRHLDSLFVGIERPVGSRHHRGAFARRGVGEHVDRGSEGACAVGRRSGSALHLNVAQRRCEVGHVDPVYVVALAVVDGHAVGRDVDARRVAASHAQSAVAYSSAGVAGGYDRGRHLEQTGNVAAVVATRYLLAAHVGEGHRSLVARPVGRDFYTPEVCYTVFRLAVGGSRGRRGRCGKGRHA